MMEPDGKSPEGGIQLGFEFTDLSRENGPHVDVHLDPVPVRAGAEPVDTATLEKPASDPGRTPLERGRAIVRRWTPAITSGTAATTRTEPSGPWSPWSGTILRIPPGGRPTARSPTAGSTGRPVRPCSASTGFSARPCTRSSWTAACPSVQKAWPLSSSPIKRSSSGSRRNKSSLCVSEVSWTRLAGS